MQECEDFLGEGLNQELRGMNFPEQSPTEAPLVPVHIVPDRIVPPMTMDGDGGGARRAEDAYFLPGGGGRGGERERVFVKGRGRDPVGFLLSQGRGEGSE